MITRHLASMIGLSLLLLAAGCGGGGADPVLPAGEQITIAAGGTVTSADGKLQLIVGANSASAEGTATITKATPPADVLADPGYVPDSAYTYSGPDIDFSPPANWEFASPRAVATRDPGRAFALAASANDVDVDRLCVPAYAQSLGQTPKTVWVRGGSCPSGCSKLRVSGAASAPTGSSMCAPPPDLQIVAQAASCPTGTVDASAEPAWAGLATDRAVRICDPVPALAAALLGTNSASALTSCGVMAGKFICKPPKVTGGFNLGLFTDATPPKSARLGLDLDWPNLYPDRALPGTYEILVSEDSATSLRFYPKADDSDGQGLGGVEIREIKLSNAPRGGGAFVSVESALVWEAVLPFSLGNHPLTSSRVTA